MIKVKSQKDLWSGLMFIGIGAAFAVGALAYSFGSSARPGPAYFPFGLGILLAIIGVFVLLSAIGGDASAEERVGAWAWKPLLVITGSVVMFGWALPHLGMVIALPLLVLVSAYAGDEFHWGEALLNAVILTLGSWLIFIKGLSLTIPLWPTFVGS